MKMNSIPSSKGTAVLVALVIAAATVGTATAVTVTTNSAPEEKQVGEEVTVEVTVSDLYSEDNQWTLNGTTQLNNVTGWKVTKVRPADNTTQEFTGQDSFSMNIRNSDNVTAIVATITGDAPTVESFSYESPQSFAAAELTKIVGNRTSDVGTVQIHHYTNDSREARQAIESAEDAAESVDSPDADANLNQAISAFNNNNFPNAIDNAEQAEDTANQAKQSKETKQLLLYAGGGVLVLALIGGGVYYYRNQQDSYDKLR